MTTAEKIALTPHPAFPPRRVSAVGVRLVVKPDQVWLAFAVDHDDALKLTDHPHGRQDNLWKHTCFELFARRASGPAYVEYNMAPLFAWAAYDFAGHRHGMRDAIVTEPHLVDSRMEDRAHQIASCYEYCARLARQGPLADDNVWLNLTAVIEEADGTKSYWALAHPHGPPDFHDPACFVLGLPAVG